MLIALMMPQTMPKEQRFRLQRVDYMLLHRYLSMYPTETTNPKFDAWYTATRMKYLIYGAGAEQPDPNIRIFNKVGLTNNYVTDVAYVVDFATGTEFFLSVTVYTRTADWPYMWQFMRVFGREVLKHQQSRRKRHPPNLDDYRHDYRRY
jgi:hypothetical protein